MADHNDAPPITSAGEYGASTVLLTKDGSLYRLAFGRNASTAHVGSGKLYHGAVMLSEEAMQELISQIEGLAE